MNVFLRSSMLVLGLIGIWQCLVCALDLPSYILPSPLAVFNTLYIQDHLIASHTLITVAEILLGFLLGITFGCVAGFICVFFRAFNLWLLPMLIISQAIPTFAIAPILVIWLGYGMAAKVVTTMLMIFFPVTSAFYDGLRTTPANWLDLANTMNATKSRLYLRLRIPAALPALSSGVRIAAVIAPLGAIIGEWVGSSEGLGYLMLNANARMQIDLVFAVLIVIIALALVLYFSIDTLLRKLVWWQTYP